MPHNKLPPDNDFNRNPRAYFTNRRGTWFDDYTKYRPYVAVPANIPLFQSATTPFPNYESRVELCSSTAYFSHRFPLPAGTKLEAAGTNGLAGHGLKRRQLEEGNETTEISERC